MVGVHILEMYNPMKKFFQQASSQGGKNADKDNSKKDRQKKEPSSLLEQIEKQVKESKAMVLGQPPVDSESMATISKKQNKLAATATSALSSDLNAT